MSGPSEVRRAVLRPALAILAGIYAEFPSSVEATPAGAILEILQRDAPTWNDYVQHRLEIERLLNEMEPQVNRRSEILNEAQSLFGSEQSFSSVLTMVRQVQALDEQYFRLLREEIRHAKE